MSPPRLPPDWAEPLAPALAAPSFARLCAFLDAERAAYDVFPAAEHVFEAFARTPIADVKVLLLGQDPYHGEGQAHGLCFSVPRGVAPPPSLRNVFRELEADLGCGPAPHGNLAAWAERGVLLLNTVLTVRAGEAHSHRGQGWEPFTDAVITALSARPTPLVALLWGGPARKHRARIDGARHRIIEGVHPSPLSAHRGFFGSRPFSAVNRALVELGHDPIDWCLPG